MKTLYLNVLFLFGIFTFGSLSAQSLFDSYARNKDVTSVVISESMFKLFAKMQVVVDDPDAQAFMELAKEITSLRVLTTSNTTVAAAMKEDAFAYAKSKRLVELMVVREEDSQVYFYAETGAGERINELLMLVTELKNVNLNGRKFETVLLSITGNLDLEKIGTLASKMDLPEELGELNRRDF
ncbi:MAG: hypothetical protein RLZZ242_249 [Bacteroidota bacterium]|jgi:hypothetical protein